MSSDEDSDNPDLTDYADYFNFDPSDEIAARLELLELDEANPNYLKKKLAEEPFFSDEYDEKLVEEETDCIDWTDWNDLEHPLGFIEEETDWIDWTDWNDLKHPLGCIEEETDWNDWTDRNDLDF